MANYKVQIEAVISYSFEVEVEADDMGEAEAIADDNYWQDEYHREARNSQMHDEFEITSVEEIIYDDGTLDDDNDFPGRDEEGR
tara:strand:+ start:870 stop:1121 length:252 start_codon:yes stop_codon:yes gene_type:complete